MSSQAPHPSVQIPQVLTAALSASVYICIAQRLGGYIVARDYLSDGVFDSREVLLGSIALLLTLLWTAKNSVDEFKAFRNDPGEAFSLGATVAFSASAYVSLATAGSLLFDDRHADWALVAFFAICTLWSLDSFRRHSKVPQQRRNNDKRRRRGRWAIVYLICALCMALFACNGGRSLVAALVVVPFAIFIWDAIDSRTFFTNDSTSA